MLEYESGFVGGLMIEVEELKEERCGMLGVNVARRRRTSVEGNVELDCSNLGPPVIEILLSSEALLISRSL